MIRTTEPASVNKRVSGKSRWRKRLVILCCMVNASSADQFGDFTYIDNGTYITITGYRLRMP